MGGASGRKKVVKGKMEAHSEWREGFKERECTAREQGVDKGDH